MRRYLMNDFQTQLVLKRDLFSETRKGHLASAPDRPMIRRDVSAAPFWSRPFGWLLARREIATMRALDGVPGTPHLVSVDADGLLRTWTEGAPLHLARPADPAWYADAFRVLRALRRAGITHNDLAKPQNWLMTPDGRAAIIDFQLASSHRRRGRLYRVMAYEDFRHLLKQMRAFAPELMTPTAKRILARRSLPSRIWMASGKKVYNFITRGIFRWSDGEGTHDRLDAEGPAIRAAYLALDGVSDVAITTYPLPRKGVGLYAFVETARPLPRIETSADIVQDVVTLPRDAQGRPRLDLLDRVAMNQTAELAAQIGDDAALARLMEPIVANRQNFTDRRISRLEG